MLEDADLGRLPNGLLVVLLRGLASEPVARLRRVPLLGALARFLTPGVTPYPDFGYRLINLYDAYSPSFSAASDASDVIRWAKAFRFSVLSFVPWRLGFVGVKQGERQTGDEARASARAE